ncbi:MAG: hypothetical protein RMJ84_10385, partial [Sandaracinaceae bacterium]|nr:hypothetical protein [Sandaracinaceae bacterium]
MSRLKFALLLWGAMCTGCGVNGPRPAFFRSLPFAPPSSEGPALFSSRPLPGCLLEGRPAFVHARTLASTFRALEFKRYPPLRALSEHEVWPFLRSHLDLVQIKRTQRIYAALGLLPLGFDLELVLLRVLQEQFLGAYDAAHQVIFLRKKHVPSLREPLSLSEHRNLKALLVHEYVHALQDQYFGTGGSASLLASLDQARAWEALLEGDALFCSLAAVGTNPMEFQISFFDSSNLDASFSGIPEFLREALLFPYVHGLSFVIAVRNGRVFHGLRGVAALNHAFMGLPLSTSTVLHHSPRPSLHHAFSFRSLIEDHGCEVLEEDTLGEFEIRVF